MQETFIKNNRLLKEDSHIDDLLDFSEISKTFEKKVEFNFSKINENKLDGI